MLPTNVQLRGQNFSQLQCRTVNVTCTSRLRMLVSCAIIMKHNRRPSGSVVQLGCRARQAAELSSHKLWPDSTTFQLQCPAGLVFK